MTKSGNADLIFADEHKQPGPGMNWSKWATLAVFVIGTLGMGTLIGMLTLPGEWYAALDKPFFNPPNWIFGPVWTILYIMIAIAGWRIWQRNFKGLSMQVWFAQLAANFMWSPVFFAMHQLGLALAIIAIMVLLTVIFIRSTWHSDRAAAMLMLPYLAWISFAALLNASLWAMN